MHIAKTDQTWRGYVVLTSKRFFTCFGCAKTVLMQWRRIYSSKLCEDFSDLPRPGNFDRDKNIFSFLPKTFVLGVSYWEQYCLEVQSSPCNQFWWRRGKMAEIRPIIDFLFACLQNIDSWTSSIKLMMLFSSCRLCFLKTFPFPLINHKRLIKILA